MEAPPSNSVLSLRADYAIRSVGSICLMRRTPTLRGSDLTFWRAWSASGVREFFSDEKFPCAKKWKKLQHKLKWVVSERQGYPLAIQAVINCHGHLSTDVTGSQLRRWCQPLFVPSDRRTTCPCLPSTEQTGSRGSRKNSKPSYKLL